jgi:rRNA maturation protein Nop10
MVVVIAISEKGLIRMPLTECPDCGHKVSTLALACPSCGRPMKEPLPPSNPSPQTKTYAQLKAEREAVENAVRPRVTQAPLYLSQSQPLRIRSDGVTTGERTGKKWKAIMLWGCFLTLVGPLLGMMCAAITVDDDSELATVMLLLPFLFGVAVHLYGRLGAWWYHG